MTFVPGGDGGLTGKIGMPVDRSSLGLGKYWWRYAKLTKVDFVVKHYIEPGTYAAGEVSFGDQGRARVLVGNRGHR